jgi:hypothetical protein
MVQCSRSIRNFVLALTAILGALVHLSPPDAPGQEPAQFKEFTANDGGFTVLMPDTPKEDKTDLATADGTKVVQYQYLVDGGTKAHLVTYQDNPAAVEKADQVQKVLEGGRDNAVTNLKGKLLLSKELKLADKHSGMEFQIEVPSLKSIYRSRIYLVGKRLYQIVVLGPKEFVDSKESDSFLDSFKLTK